MKTLTTESKFNKLPRYIYQIHCSNGNKIIHTFFTKDGAYSKMENIKKALDFNQCCETVQLNDLDMRPEILTTDAGCVYSLLTIHIEY